MNAHEQLKGELSLPVATTTKGRLTLPVQRYIGHLLDYQQKIANLEVLA
jgi:hypothetical protein